MANVANPQPPFDPESWGPAPFQPVPFEQLRAELLELYRPPLRAKATHCRMRQTLAIVAGLVGPDATTAVLTPGLVGRLIASRPPEQSAHTTEALLRNLRVVCNYAVTQGYLRCTPFAFRKKWVRTPAPLGKKHHSAEDIARVLELARADVGRKGAASWSQWRARRLYALVSTVAYTGLRRNEALRLRAEDIDLRNRMLLIVERSGSRLKTEGSAAPVPIPEALAQILAEWLPYLALPEGMAEDATGDDAVFAPASNPTKRRDPGWVFPNVYRTGPWCGGSPGNRPIDRIKRLGERAGVAGFTFMSLRHSWATMAESRWGLSEAMIQRCLRHTQRRTQMHYRHADPGNLRAAVQGLGFGHEPAESPRLPEAAPVPDLDFPALPPSGPTPTRRGALTERRRPSGTGVRKLDAADAAEMRLLRGAGWTYKDLMHRFQVSKSTVHYTLYGVIHKAAGAGEGIEGDHEATEG